MPPHPGDDELARVVRDDAGRIVGLLARWCGNLDLAEEAVSEAVLEALRSWRAEGVPVRPAAWLHTAAKRNVLDHLRRSEARGRWVTALGSVAELRDVPGSPGPPGPGDPDERLPLLFTCCHPALGREAQLALTLRAVVGLTTGEIASALLTAQSTIAQRISRAKAKIVAAGVPLTIPTANDLGPRLDQVLTVLYLAFNEGYLASGEGEVIRRDLAEDAIWLGTVLATSLPREAEVLGLLALMILVHARVAARRDTQGHLVVLADQDRSLWDGTAIGEGVGLLERAGALARPGRFQIQAAIAALHAEAPTYGETDWPQIVALYDLLQLHDLSPVVRLNRAVAFAHLAGPEAALIEVEAVAPHLQGYHLLHAVRAHLLRGVGRADQAREADARALELTRNAGEREVLRRRLFDA